MFYSDTFKGEFTLKHETSIDLNTFSNNLIVNFFATGKAGRCPRKVHYPSQLSGELAT